MNQPYAIPPGQVGLLDRVMPTSKSWGWLWRLRYALLGRKKTINLDSTIINLTASNSLMVVDLLPGHPDFARSDGLRVWRLSESEVNSLRKRLKEATDDHILASSRVTTGDGAEAQIFCGSSTPINGKQQQVGFSVALLPRIRNGITDLTAVAVFSEAETNQTTLRVEGPQAGSFSIQTNFAFGGRFQLSRESAGIFVLHSSSGLTNKKEIGLLLTSQVLQPKK